MYIHVLLHYAVIFRKHFFSVAVFLSSYIDAYIQEKIEKRRVGLGYETDWLFYSRHVCHADDLLFPEGRH